MPPVHPGIVRRELTNSVVTVKTARGGIEMHIVHPTQRLGGSARHTPKPALPASISRLTRRCSTPPTWEMLCMTWSMFGSSRVEVSESSEVRVDVCELSVHVVRALVKQSGTENWSDNLGARLLRFCQNWGPIVLSFCQNGGPHLPVSVKIGVLVPRVSVKIGALVFEFLSKLVPLASSSCQNWYPCC